MRYFSKAMMVASAALCLNLSAYAQDISLKINNVTVKEAIELLKKNTGYSFVFSSSDLNTRQHVSVSAENATIEEVVNQILKGQKGIDYEIQGKKIVVKKANLSIQKSSKQIPVNGKVLDTKGEPIIGATIKEIGTTNGTITDYDGNFTLDAIENGYLEISYVGYKSQKIKIQKGKLLAVTLNEDAETLEEVIVTAFGIKREEKALGYAVQKVKGDALATVKSVDVGTALTGKIAGLNVKNSSEFNTAPSIEIRGESPLIVIDGVPYGNINLRDINSDDIESLDVLKGATASALYGARGGNGVIMITTKKAEKEGLDISINSSTMFNAGYLAIPEAQHSYSSGTGGKYDSKDYVWGDKLDIGRTAIQYNPFTYQWEEQPLVSKGKDNFRNFLEQGFSTNNNISIGWKGKNGGFRTSLNHVYNKGQYPNQKLHKLTYTLSGNAKLGNLSVEAGAIWNKRFYSNDRGAGYGGGGYIYNLIVWTGADYDIREYKDYWIKGKEGEQQNWRYTAFYDNPYMLANECTRSNDYDKLNTYVYAKYDFLPWLNISTRTGVDFYADRFESKNPIGTFNVGNKNGSYSVTKNTGFSLNSDVILAANHKFDDFTIDGILGASTYYYFDDGLTASTSNGISVPGFYSLNASIDPITASGSYTSKQLNSVYAKLSASWRSLLYLDITGRNDWSSTLPAETRSYFYPSVSGSLIMSEFLNLPDPLTFWKLRGSWTVTKTDPSVFEIQQAYDVSTNVWNGLNSASYPTMMRSNTLKPKTSRSYEIGTAFNLWNNRLRFDVAYYSKLQYNLTRQATISSASGFSNTLLNYDEQWERKGVEVAVSADLIQTKDWDWTVNINWARDRWYYNQIDDVYSTQNEWVQKGLRWDWLAGYDWERDPQGNIILYNGLPKMSDYKTFQGYEYPDWIWGVNSTLRYKNWMMSISFDGRVGGTRYNKTEQAMWNSGSHPDSDTPERYEEVVNGNITFVAPGVKIVSGEVKYDTDGNIISDTRVFAPNDVPVSYQSYIQAYQPWAGSGAFQNYRSTTFLKVRELSLTYTLPKKACNWFSINDASVSFIAQNLLLWAKEFKYADPDADGDDLNSPSQRFLGFNVKINF